MTRAVGTQTHGSVNPWVSKPMGICAGQPMGIRAKPKPMLGLSPSIPQTVRDPKTLQEPPRCQVALEDLLSMI